MSWHSVHVARHGADHDALLLDAVRPLFERVSGQVSGAYWLRHWKRGPHLRLNFRTDPETFTARVRPAVDEVVGGYLAAHPSTARPDPAALLPLHERLAALEGEPGPLVPWYPDDSVHDAGYDRRLAALGGGEAADLLAEFYVRTTGLAFAMTEHVHRRRGPRLGVAFDVLLATAHALSAGGGIAGGFVSFRSHAEAFLSAWPEGRGRRPSWDRQYARQREVLTRRVGAVVETLDTDRESVPFVRAWVAAVEPIRQEGRAHLEAGRIAVGPATAGGNERQPGAPGTADAPRDVGANLRDLRESSGFHRLLDASERWQREVAPSTWFALYRLVLNDTYLHLTRLGVTPEQRFMLCHLAANAVEDAYGVSAAEVVRG